MHENLILKKNIRQRFKQCTMFLEGRPLELCRNKSRRIFSSTLLKTSSRLNTAYNLYSDKRDTGTKWFIASLKASIANTNNKHPTNNLVIYTGILDSIYDVVDLACVRRVKFSTQATDLQEYKIALDSCQLPINTSDESLMKIINLG